MRLDIYLNKPLTKIYIVFPDGTKFYRRKGAIGEGMDKDRCVIKTGQKLSSISKTNIYYQEYIDRDSNGSWLAREMTPAQEKEWDKETVGYF